jgi:hypothetical protein
MLVPLHGINVWQASGAAVMPKIPWYYKFSA